MKNLMIYLRPEKNFDEASRLMTEVEIINSLDFWKPEDILLVTNFPYEYQGIKSMVVNIEDCIPSNYAEVFNNVWRFVKFFTTIYLIEKGIVNELTWVHDFDSYQLTHLDLPPLDRDLFLIDYGYDGRIQLGNVFFKPSAIEVFKWMTEKMLEYRVHEEDVLNKYLLPQNYNNIHSRFRKLNTTYNIGVRNVELKMALAEKPIKIAHFHPFKRHQSDQYRNTNLLPEKLHKLLNERFNLGW